MIDTDPEFEPEDPEPFDPIPIDPDIIPDIIPDIPPVPVLEGTGLNGPPGEDQNTVVFNNQNLGNSLTHDSGWNMVAHLPMGSTEWYPNNTLLNADALTVGLDSNPVYSNFLLIRGHRSHPHLLEWQSFVHPSFEGPGYRDISMLTNVGHTDNPVLKSVKWYRGNTQNDYSPYIFSHTIETSTFQWSSAITDLVYADDSAHYNEGPPRNDYMYWVYGLTDSGSVTIPSVST